MTVAKPGHRTGGRLHSSDRIDSIGASPAPRVLSELLLIFACLGGLAQDTIACMCVPPAPPLVAMGRADAVFIGRAVRVESAERHPSSGDVTWTFREVVAWKGVLADSVRVHTSESGASCGYGFTSGREYLVYCESDSAGLQTSLCSRTCPAETARRDREAFDSLGVAGPPERVNAAILDRFLAAAQSPDSTARMDGYRALQELGRLDPARIVPVLGERYRKGIERERSEIVWALASTRSPSHGALELLRVAMADASPRVRSRAIGAAPLLGMPDAELRSTLEQGMRDPAAEVREIAVSLIAPDLYSGPFRHAVFSPDEALERLLQALRDPGPRVRMVAAYGFFDYESGDLVARDLAERAGRPLPPVTRPDKTAGPDPSRDAAVHSALLQAARDPDPIGRQAGVTAVSSLHPRDAEIQGVLLGALADSSGEVRARALSALGVPGPLEGETAAALTRAVRESREGERDPALSALAGLASAVPAACDSLLAVYLSISTEERRSVLGQLPIELLEPEQAFRLLARTVHDSNANLRAQGLFSLARIRSGGETGQVGLLIEALADPDMQVRLASVRTLEGLSARAVSAVPALERAAAADSAEPVRRLAGEAVARIRAAR